MRRQIRAASIADSTEGSAERSQVIYRERTDPTTNRHASCAKALDATRVVAERERKRSRERTPVLFVGSGTAACTETAAMAARVAIIGRNARI